MGAESLRAASYDHLFRDHTYSSALRFFLIGGLANGRRAVPPEKGKTMMYLTRITIVLGLLAVTGCATTPPPEFPETARAKMDSRGVQRVDIIAGNYYFRPNHIIIKANAPVVLTIRKESGIVPHTFFIDAPEAGIRIDMPLSPEPGIVNFTPERAGNYVFYCNQRGLFGSHREKGMEGVLEVIR